MRSDNLDDIILKFVDRLLPYLAERGRKSFPNPDNNVPHRYEEKGDYDGEMDLRQFNDNLDPSFKDDYKSDENKFTKNGRIILKCKYCNKIIKPLIRKQVHLAADKSC